MRKRQIAEKAMYVCFVKCPLCGEEHLTHEVEILDIEENFFGEDLLYYTCPTVNEPASARVLRKA